MMLSECDNNVEETERGVGPSVICSVVDHSSYATTQNRVHCTWGDCTVCICMSSSFSLLLFFCCRHGSLVALGDQPVFVQLWLERVVSSKCAGGWKRGLMRTKRILFTTAVHQNSSTLQKLFSQCDVKLLLRQSGLLIGQWQSGLLLVSAYHRYIYIYIHTSPGFRTSGLSTDNAVDLDR